MLLMTSKIEGFRRCGVAHSATPTEWVADAFSDDQITRLKAEPMLTVEEFQYGDGDGDLAVKAKKLKAKSHAKATGLLP